MYGINPPNASMIFQFIDDNKIFFRDKSSSQQDTIIDYDVYQEFVEEKKQFDRKFIELIPENYFTFMKDNMSITQIAFDENFWNHQVKPKFSNKLNECIFQFQKEAVFRMIKMKKCLNASSMGIGKSLQGLAALSYFKNNLKGDVIICPGYLRKNWEQEAKLWLPEHLHKDIVIINKAGKKEIQEAIRILLHHKGVIIISYDMCANIFEKLKPSLRKGKYWNTVLLDESHFIKDVKTKRYKMLQGAIKQSHQTFLLSGTPSPNRPKELFAQFALLQPKVFNNYQTFAFRYCNAFFDYFKKLNDRGSSNIDELAFLMSKIVIRLRREDVLEDLPEKLRYKQILSPTSTPVKFKKLLKEFQDKLKNHDEEDKSTSFKLQSLASEMFRETAVIKEKPIIDFLSDYIQENDRKTVLFCKHQVIFKSIQTFLENNSIGFISIDGSTNMQLRPKLIDTFLNEESCKYALLTIGSCQTGLNIKGIDKMIFCELSWSPAELAQCEARITRLGTTKSHLEYIYLICENTLDNMVFNKLTKKSNLFNNIIDNGKEYGDFDFVERPTKKTKLCFS